VQCILEAGPQMCNVLVFLFFIIFFFALIGCALFRGGLRFTCHALGADNVTWESTDETCRPWCTWDDSTLTLNGECLSLGANTYGQENYHDPVHWTYSCRAGQQCLCADNGLADPTCSIFGNPNHGITSFDSMPWAIVSLFQAISLEGWVDMMYQLQDGVSSWVWIYFIMLVLIGAIIVINLFLAVLCDNFEMADRDGPEEEEEDDGEEIVAAEAAKLKHSNPIRQACLNLVTHRYFDWFVQGCIVLNTFVMMLKYLPQPSSDLRISINAADQPSDYMPYGYWIFGYVTNITLTAIFALESLFKIIGYGPRLFLKNKVNTFDLFVVIFSVIEIVIDLMSRLSGQDIYFPLPLSVLRAFRIFRLFKLVKSMPSLRKIIETLIQSMASVSYLAMLLLLMILIFMLLGMELFGGLYPRPEPNYTEGQFPLAWSKDRITWDGDASRYHFDDVGNAFLVIFVVLSGENWNEIMFDSHTASFKSNMASDLPLPYAMMYFILLFVIGNLLLFNLFIAILLSNFDDDDEEEEEDEDNPEEILGADAMQKEPSSPALKKPQEPMMEWKFNGYMSSTVDMEGAKATSTRESKAPTANGEPAEDDDEKPPPPAELFPTGSGDDGGDKSMYIFSWQNPLRTNLARLVSHWVFEACVISLICVSTLLMLLDMPHLIATHWSRVAIGYCNIAFAIIFLIEMFMKWIVHGVYKSKTPVHYQLAQPYFGSLWNWLDFFIVCISIVGLFNIEGIQGLRAFRALRPLRLVSRYEDLKITVATLFKSIPAMTSLLSVASLFFVIFAILGVELYGGKLGYCMDPEYADEPYGSRVIPGMNGAQTDYEECMTLPRYNLTRRTTSGILFTEMADMFPNEPWLDFTEFPQWFYPQFGNFDNLALSLFLLFEISALEGWPDVMHVAMDSDSTKQYVVPWRLPNDMGGGLGGVGVPMETHLPQQGMTAIFFIAWIIVGCFVVVNMTVGVVVDTFSQIKAENDGLLLMSEDAADWVKAQKQVFAQRPLVQAAPPKEAWRLNVYYLVTSTKFEIGIMGCILANMLQMGCDWWEPANHEGPWVHEFTGQPGQAGEPNFPMIGGVKDVMTVLNYIFLAIYIVEMFLKWVGLGIVQYFKDVTNAFDCFLVVVSTFEAVVSAMPSTTMPMPIGFIRVLRLFRIIRLMRVIKTAKSLRTVIMTVYISLPQLKNIMILIGMIIIIFDVLCVSFFSFSNYTPGNHDTTADHTESQARGEVLPQDDAYYFHSSGTNWGDYINRHANFQFWWTGGLLLMRSATGESFNGLMHDLFDWHWGDNRLKCCLECGPILDGSLKTYMNFATGVAYEAVKPESSCGNTWVAGAIYFFFQILMSYIVLSIMIGVILENFTNVGSETRKISMDDLEEFREVWLKYDPKGTFIVPSHNLLAILQQLKRPLGIAGSEPALTRAEMLKHLGKLDIPDHGGYIHFMETLTAVSHAHAGVPVPVCDTTKKMQRDAQKVPKLKVLDKPAHNALTNYLVSLLQSRWRGYAMRQKYDGDPAAPSGDAPPSYPPPKVKANQVAPEPTPAS